MAQSLPNADFYLQNQQRLTAQVLSDIYAIADEIGPMCHSQYPIQQLLFLIQEMEKGVKTPTRYHLFPFILPELYQWLIKSVEYLEKSDEKKLVNHVKQLPVYLTCSVLNIAQHKIDYPIPYFTDENVEFKFPQNMMKIKFTCKEKWVPAVLKPASKQLEIKICGKLYCLNLAVDKQIPPITGVPIYLKQDGFGLREWVETRLSEEGGLYSKEEMDLKLVPYHQIKTKNIYQKSITNLGKAFKMIKSCWPELYEEMICAIRAICILKGKYFIGGSDVGYLGVVALNPRLGWSQYTFCDHLVHEAAHQVLFTYQELDPFLKNPEKNDLPSPIRKDLRHLNGVFHATFVFYRLCLFFEKLCQTDKSDEATNRWHLHLRQFYEGMETVQKNAQFTHHGRQFFKELKKEMRRFKLMIPCPSIKKSELITDYDEPF